MDIAVAPLTLTSSITRLLSRQLPQTEIPSHSVHDNLLVQHIGAGLGALQLGLVARLLVHGDALDLRARSDRRHRPVHDCRWSRHGALIRRGRICETKTSVMKRTHGRTACIPTPAECILDCNSSLSRRSNTLRMLNNISPRRLGLWPQGCKLPDSNVTRASGNARWRPSGRQGAAPPRGLAEATGQACWSAALAGSCRRTGSQ